MTTYLHVGGVETLYFGLYEEEDIFADVFFFCLRCR